MLHLRKHQLENVAFLRGRKGAAILDEQGLGKSCSVIAYLDELQATKGRPLRALVVCPTSIMHTWAGEVRKFAKALAPVVVSGSKAKRLKLLGNKYEQGVIWIVNYEFARSLRKTKENLARTNPAWDVIVADEMTRIKNRTSITARALHDFVKHSPETIRIGMTGTPITNSPLDAFSQFLFVDPTLFGSRYAEFESRYAFVKRANYGGGPFNQVTGYRNLDDMVQRIHRVSIRHEKAKCLDLPEKTHQKISLEFDTEQRRVYEELKRDMIAECQGKVVTAANALSSLMKLQQVTSGFFYSGMDDRRTVTLVGKRNPKVEALLDLVQDASSPVVVWCRFKADIDIVMAALDKAKISAVAYNSELSKERRAQVTDNFQHGLYKVLVAQTVIAQFGLTWTKASTAIFYSQSWSVEETMQAQDRIHRIGQTDPCSYYYLVIEGSVDEACFASVNSKSKLASSIAAKDLVALANGETECSGKAKRA